MKNKNISKFISIGIKIAALLLIVLFFVPSVCVSCEGMEVSFSAFEAAIGSVDEEMAQAYDFILFAIPALAVIILIVANKNYFVSMFATVANLLSMIAYIIAVEMRLEASFAGSDYEGMEVLFEVKPEFAFFLHIILCILIIGALVYEKYFLKEYSENAADEPEKEQVTSAYCKECGAPITPTDQFCTKCASKVSSDADDTVGKEEN